MLSIFVIVSWLLIIGVFSLSARTPLKSRRLAFVRVLFPSWRFFDRLEQVPKVFCRARVKDGEFGAWQALPVAHRRAWTAFFLNPEGNLELAVSSLIERLVSEVNESAQPGEVADSVSLRLMERVVRGSLATPASPAGGEFQFKISVLDTRMREFTGDLLVSAVYPLNERLAHDGE